MTRATRLQRLARWVAALGPTVVLALPAYGSMIDAVTPDIFISAVSFGAPASGIADGYGPSNAALPSTFSKNFLVVSGNGTEFSSAPLLFSNVGYTSLNGQAYFAFVLDAQETQSNASLSIDRVRITVNGVEVWRTTEAILLNSGAKSTRTLTPLGNGADMALYVPVAVFDGLSLTGSSAFVFSATHSLGHNGGDEWRLTDYGVIRDPTGVVRRFNPNQLIASDIYSIPEPSSGLLLLAGLGVLSLARRFSR